MTTEEKKIEDTELIEISMTINKLELEHANIFKEFKDILKNCTKKALVRLLVGLHQMETTPIKCMSVVEESMFKISNTIRGLMQQALMLRTYKNQLLQNKKSEEKISQENLND